MVIPSRNLFPIISTGKCGDWSDSIYITKIYSKSPKLITTPTPQRPISLDCYGMIPSTRRQKETQIIDVTINDTIVQVSTAREERVSFVSKLVSSPGPHNFKFENNVWLQITTTELEYVISQIDAKVQEAFDWEYTKVQEIDACETGEDVYDVVLIEEVIPDALS